MSEFREALETWNKIEEDIDFNMGCTMEEAFNNRPIKEMKISIRKALQIADKLMQEPSEGMIWTTKAAVKTTVSNCDCGITTWTATSANARKDIYKAMRDQMLKEIEDDL